MQRAIVLRLSSILMCGWVAAQLLACDEAAGGGSPPMGPAEGAPGAAVTLESEAPASVPADVSVRPGEGFTSFALTPASTLSVALVEVTPTESMLDGVIGLSDGAPSGFGDLAAAMRFAPSGVLEARDGNVYRADHVVPYVAGRTFRIHMIADVLSHTYSVYVYERAFTPIRLAGGYAFRPSQRHVKSLDTLSAIVDSPSGQLSITGAGAQDTSTVAYAREGAYAVSPLPGGQALVSDRVATTWKLGPAGQVLEQTAHGGEVAADEAGNVYVARVDRGQLELHAFTPRLRPRWSRVDPVEPSASVHAIAADAAGVSVSLRNAQGLASIRRYPASGAAATWVRDGGTLAAVGRDGVAVATQDPDGITLSLYALDGCLRWSRSFTVAATVEVVTLGLSGRVVLGGHYSAPITFGGPTLDLEGGNADAHAYSYVVAFAGADGAHVFTRRIDLTRLTGADANGGRLVIAGEEQAQQLYPYLLELDPAGNVIGSRSSIFYFGWGRSGRVAIDSSNRIYWELSMLVWGLEFNLPVFPYLVVLRP